MKKDEFVMDIPSSVGSVMERLHCHGYESYAVGGCVRDAMLGKTPNDYDVTTSATPDEMLCVFKGSRCIETGLKHGTLTVVSDGENIEVTTYRIDGEYLDNRRPKEVFFTRNVEEDLSRRDFTVNAMAYSPITGLVDPFLGRVHLKEKRIVCVGRPYDRFHEDGLRILRALRFSSVLDFEIEENTRSAVLSEKKLLKNISAERIFAELSKLLLGRGAYRVLSEYRCVFEEFCEIFGDDLEYKARMEAIDRSDKILPVRMTLLFGGCNEAANSVKALKTDGNTADRVKKLSLIRSREVSGELRIKGSVELKKLVSVYGYSAVSDYLALKRALLDEGSAELTAELGRIMASGECVSIDMLDIDGRDVTALGVKGKAVGDLLKTLLTEVIEGSADNKRESLIERARVLSKMRADV